MIIASLHGLRSRGRVCPERGSLLLTLLLVESARQILGQLENNELKMMRFHARRVHVIKIGF